MSDRQLAAGTIDHQRLRIFQRARSARRIPDVTDRSRSDPQLLQVLFLEHLGNQTHAPVNIKRLVRSCRGDDSGAFLAPMLQGKEAIISQ
jgi:hypothetical protein